MKFALLKEDLLNSVDIRLVPGKGLHRFACTNIPHLGRSVARARDEQIGIGRERDTTVSSYPLANSPHDVSGMITKLHRPHVILNIPQHTRHIARARNDLAIIDKATARQVTTVRRQLPRNFDLPRPARSGIAQRIDGTDIVQPATSDKLARRGIGTRHDPGRTQGDRVHLVGRVRVPDDEFAVLRGGNEVSLVGRPVERVYFGQVPFEGSSWFHRHAREGCSVVGHCSYLTSVPATGPFKAARRIENRDVQLVSAV